MKNITIISRTWDHRNMTVHKFKTYIDAFTFALNQDDRDEIVFVKHDNTCVYSSLTSPNIKWSDLVEYFQ